MKISKIQTNSKPQYQKTTFKKGLTSYEISQVNKMGRYEYETITQRVKNLYGINADVGKSNTVAFCLESVAKIMERAGFKLPKNFVFAPAGNALGTYAPLTDTVTINSNYEDFNNLETQNRLEERQDDYHPDTHHFLHTYLHEFSHAAHYKNLCDRHGRDKGWNLFMHELDKFIPNKLVLDLDNTFLKDSMLGIFLGRNTSVQNGNYARKNLTEYFAEYNARELAVALGDNFYIHDVPTDFKSRYVEHPFDWDGDKIKKQMRNKIRFVKSVTAVSPVTFMLGSYFASNVIQKSYINEDIKYLNGDIWQGNIDAIKNKCITLTYNDDNYWKDVL